MIMTSNLLDSYESRHVTLSEGQVILFVLSLHQFFAKGCRGSFPCIATIAFAVL